MKEKYLSNEELRELSTIRPWRVWVGLISDWALIIANFTLAAMVPHPVVWVFCFCLAARQQLALAVLMHDGSHRRMFKSGKWNDYICQFLCAAPVFFSMYSYQKLHLKHHQEPLADDDPDLSLIGGYPISTGSFARKLLRDALGISYFKFIRYFLYMARKNRVKKEGQDKIIKNEVSTKSGRIPFPIVVFSMLFMNGLIFGALWATGHPWHYLFFWVLPAMTALQVLLRIRGVAEHAGYSPNPDQRLNARTVVSPVQTFIFAPHNVNLHIEHHIYPAIPYYNLPKLHKIFVERNVLPSQNTYTGYGKILREIIT